ncbi:MAG TPA: prepilin-type N-terminal cleavage/methylation domain-containing protein [Verrucomicrobiae bacterium]|nr:prepilin-type N-terminal cleavage/methylation domain-containing protein [Verrucomicrobiae bacterium]
MNSRRGYTLIEVLVYIAVLLVVMDVAYTAYARYDKGSRDLRRNADDIIRALRVGQRWRDDVRAAVGPLRVTANGVVIPEGSGEIEYAFADGTLWRQKIALLKQVKASAMRSDARPHVVAWRWELELASPKKMAHVRPLFSFTAVPGEQS